MIVAKGFQKNFNIGRGLGKRGEGEIEPYHNEMAPKITVSTLLSMIVPAANSLPNKAQPISRKIPGKNTPTVNKFIKPQAYAQQSTFDKLLRCSTGEDNTQSRTNLVI